MDLSRNVIKRYVSVSTPQKVTSNSDTRYGTVVSEGEELFVMIDGSSILTPVSSNIDLKDGDRVLVLVENHEAIVLGSPTSPTARLEELRALEEGVTEFEVILADKVGTGELVAMQALIEDLEAKDVEISGKLNANTASIETLTAENATINGKLDVYQADIEELQADSAKIEKLEADNVKINDTLTAQTADISNLQADFADIDTLIFGSASGTTIQTSFANAVIAQLGNAQIKSAMIDNVSASKIAAGDILTNNVRVLSEDGKLLISDETIQISDDARVRVQIGKDSSNDYSINIWDADGKLMFSQGGITDAAIKDAIIRNDMVANDANIAASKLDISSLFTEINNSTETINSNRVLIDTDAGTLDVAFTQMSSDLNDISDEVTSQGTALSVVQGQINSKVWMEDIGDIDLSEIEGSISTLETQYSELNQTVDGISATVANHTTQIANKAEGSAVTAVNNRVTEVEAGLEGFKTSVSETYTTKSEFNDLEIGGRNLLYLTETMPVGENDAGNACRHYATYNTYGELSNTDDGVKLTFDSVTSASMLVPLASFGNVVSGSVMTLSFEYRGNITKPGYLYFLQETSPNVPIPMVEPLVDDEDWHEYSWTFVGTDANARVCQSILLFYANVDYDSSKWIEIKYKSLKLETGNKVTDWSPAPEDVDSKMDDATSKFSDSVADVNTRLDGVDGLITEISSKTDSSLQLIEENKTQIASLIQQADGFTMNFETITETITELNDQFYKDRDERISYIRFVNGEIWLGKQAESDEDDFKMVISNERVSFLQNDVEVAYLSNNKLYITDAQITGSLRIGNYLIQQRSSGNIGIRWVD